MRNATGASFTITTPLIIQPNGYVVLANSVNNDHAAFWCLASTTFSVGLFGTPGAPNFCN